MKNKFSHLDCEGKARMVDITEKEDTFREAVAAAEMEMSNEVIDLINNHKIAKGDVFAAARIAGIMAAKNTSNLIPLCHQIPLGKVNLEFTIENNRVNIESVVKTYAKTGVEMEALTAVSVAALTIYDMCKAIDKGIVISDIKLIRKSGGKSGNFIRRENN